MLAGDGARVRTEQERGESRDFLGARTALDADRLRALDPGVDLDAVAAVLRAWETTCMGGAGSGPAGELRLGERFRWLTAPRSTVVQPGPVHSGLTEDPAAELDRLLELARIDFAPIYESVKGQPELEPGDVLATDQVLTRGTGRYHHDKRMH